MQMSRRHLPGHPLREAAFKFRRLLRGAMERADVTRDQLAERSGVSSVGAIKAWMVGDSLPTFAHASALAAALDEPALADLVRTARTRPCAVCGIGVLTEKAGAPRLYCSDLHQEVATKKWGKDTAHKAAHFQRIADAAMVRIDLHVKSVADFCRSCEPEGSCRDRKCALRPVSPLPLLRGIA